MKRGANDKRYMSPLAATQKGLMTAYIDQLARKGSVKADQRHVQKILESGRLYGPMTHEAQLKAVEYAYGIKLLR